MKIALIGYGKMGKTIEKIALGRGHEIIARIDWNSNIEEIKGADVAIEFSTPETAVTNLTFCAENKIPVECGTTGWLDKLSQIEIITKEHKGAFLYASNFSLGVNLFFEINKKIAHLMHTQPSYSVRMDETHHTEKKDAPSGTAISLAQDILPIYSLDTWKLGTKSSEKELAIEALRIENVPGTHTVYYQSEVDTIEIKHTAHSREGFALGAVLAAEWITNKEGIFTMKDVLGL